MSHEKLKNKNALIGKLYIKIFALGMQCTAAQFFQSGPVSIISWSR